MRLFLDLAHKGGPTTWFILVLGVVTTFIVVERWLYLHRAQLANVGEFLRGITNVLRKNKATEAIALCEESPGPVPRLVRAAILHADADSEEIRRAIAEVGLEEIPRLERNLKLLLTFVHLAPLCGLLGTVLGIIYLFQGMEAEGNFMAVQSMAKSLWPALISTAAGLCVAIPAYGFYMYLVERVEAIILDMEKAASEIVYFLRQNPVSLARVESPDRGNRDDDSAQPAEVAESSAPAAGRRPDADPAR